MFNVFSDVCFPPFGSHRTNKPNKKWPYYTPQLAFMLIYIICIALGIAIGAMLTWHLWLVMKGQTTVESHDAVYYKKMAKERGGAAVSSPPIYCPSDPSCSGIRQLLRPRSSREPQALLQCHIYWTVRLPIFTHPLQGPSLTSLSLKTALGGYY
jgi:hypothetical protein